MWSALSDVILPVVIVAGVGFVLGRRFPLQIDTLSKVGLYAFTPALAYHSMMTTEISASVGSRVVVAYLLMTAVVAAVSWLVTWRWPTRVRRSVTACTMLGNNGNFGLPIALLALGQEGLDIAVVILVTSLVVMYGFGPMLFGSHGGLLSGLRVVARLPVTWAIVAAGAFRLAHVSPPTGVSAGIEILGQAAIPIVLVQLGVQIASSGRLDRSGPVLAAVALRAIVVPLAAVGVGLTLGLDGIGLASLVLAAAMPIAVNSLLLAREYGGDGDSVAGSVVISTFCSIPILVVLVSVLPRLTG